MRSDPLSRVAAVLEVYVKVNKNDLIEDSIKVNDASHILQILFQSI